MRRHKLLISLLMVMFLFGVNGHSIAAQPVDVSDLADDIPEPQNSGEELPSPVPLAYEFIGGMMAGDYDRCLANFDVRTFMSLLFAKQLKIMSPSDFDELYAYQVQSQRNEFRFLSKMMYRLAKDAKFAYSNPRFHGKRQCKVNVQMKTTKGNVNFTVYCRYLTDRWIVYDYTLNNQRYSQVFKTAFGNLKLDDYIRMLRPFYDDSIRYRLIKNDDFGFSFKVPDYLAIRNNVAPGLLYSISGLDGHLLIHVQATTYSQPQTLNQVAVEIKRGIMPFKPRLYDQWKTDIAGVDIGHILFKFEKNGKTLYNHMMIVPMGRKLVVLNFYHSTLQLMKHYSTIRDKIFETFSLPKIEALGGDLSIPSDDLALPAGIDVSNEPPPPVEQFQGPSAEELPPPPEDDSLTDDGNLQADSPVAYDQPNEGEELPPPPQPEPANGEESPDEVPNSQYPSDLHGNSNDELPPPPPPSSEDDLSGSEVTF